jgi:hypothetical protein
MWTVTDEQFNFLKVRFKDPLLWLEDCDRWIGRPLTVISRTGATIGMDCQWTRLLMNLRFARAGMSVTQ